MLVKKIKYEKSESFLFLFGRTKTDFPGLSKAGTAILEALDPFIKENGIKITGPCVWMHDHIGGGQVQLKAGFQIAKGPESTGTFTVEQVPEWDCVSGEYKGSMENIAQAWDEFTAKIKEDGDLPLNVNREIYRRWFGPDSPENVTELQVQIKPGEKPARP